MSAKLDARFQARQTSLGHYEKQQMRAVAATAVAAPEELSEQDYEAWRSTQPEEAEAVNSMVEAMAKGEVSPAEAFGISDAELAFAAQLGAEQLELGQLENAERIFLGLTSAAPTVPHFHVSLGQVCAAQQRHAEAYDALSDGIELFTQLPKEQLPVDFFIDAILLRGETLIRLQRPEEAASDLTVVLEAYQDKLEKLQTDNPSVMAKLAQVQLMLDTLQDS